MKRLGWLFIVGMILSGCSGALRVESPFRMSDEEFNQKVAALVNPPLQQLQAKYEDLEKKVSKDE